jgi:RNA polymerase sigma factor (sigma-70 family)
MNGIMALSRILQNNPIWRKERPRGPRSSLFGVSDPLVCLLEPATRVMRLAVPARRQALGCAEASASLNQAVSPDGDTELADFLADPAAADPVEAAERSLLRQTVRYRLERLPERERLIVERRFGLQGEPQSLETVGRGLGLTRERVRQLQGRALKQLETELADLAPVQTAAAGTAQAREAERVPP